MPAGAVPVGFGGYVGSARVDSALHGDESTSFTVVFWCLLVVKLIFPLLNYRWNK